MFIYIATHENCGHVSNDKMSNGPPPKNGRNTHGC